MLSSLWPKKTVIGNRDFFNAINIFSTYCLAGTARAGSTKLDQTHVLISSSSQLAVYLIFLDLIPIWPSHKPHYHGYEISSQRHYNIRDSPDCYPIYLNPVLSATLLLSLCPPASPYFSISVSLLWV